MAPSLDVILCIYQDWHEHYLCDTTYKSSFSRNTTGSGSLIAALSRPRASSAEYGTSTFSPGHAPYHAAKHWKGEKKNNSAWDVRNNDSNHCGVGYVPNSTSREWGRRQRMGKEAYSQLIIQSICPCLITNSKECSKSLTKKNEGYNFSSTLKE